ALWRAQAFVSLGRVVGDLQGARIGQSDVLPGHAHDAAREVAWVRAAIQHAAQPVQRSVGIRAPDRLVQSGYLIVEAIAALVEAPGVECQGVLDESRIDMACAAGLRRSAALFEQVEKAPGIAVGVADQSVNGLLIESEAA